MFIVYSNLGQLYSCKKLKEAIKMRKKFTKTFRAFDLDTKVKIRLGRREK